MIYLSNMDIFEEIKEKADILKTCEILGIKINKNKALCPFHKEKTPSFTISQSKQIWKCFGCDKSGDVISLVQEILKISPLEACKFLNDKLCLNANLKSSTTKYEANRHIKTQNAKEKFKKWENKTFQLLCDYLHSLSLVEKYQQQDTIEYFLDIFIYGTDEDKLWFYKTEKEWCKEIERRLRRTTSTRI